MSKILVVDDHTPTLKIYEKILSKAGHCVEAAENLEKATRLVESESFDAAIMDVFLPDGNGIDLAKRLKTGSPKTLRIVNTGSQTWLDIAKEEKAADAYFLKPVNLPKLLEIIKDNPKF